MIALCNSQGTACAETGLCNLCDSPQAREDAALMALGDTLPESWVECSENEAVTCCVCGSAAPFLED